MVLTLICVSLSLYFRIDADTRSIHCSGKQVLENERELRAAAYGWQTKGGDNRKGNAKVAARSVVRRRIKESLNSIASDRSVAAKGYTVDWKEAEDNYHADPEGDELTPPAAHSEMDIEKNRVAIEAGRHFLEKAASLFESALAVETKDNAWRNTILDKGNAYLEEEGFGNTFIEKVDCGTTICKIVFSHKDKTAEEAFIEEGIEGGPWLGDQYGVEVELEDGGLGTCVFFARQDDHDAFYHIAELSLQKQN